MLPKVERLTIFHWEPRTSSERLTPRQLIGPLSAMQELQRLRLVDLDLEPDSKDGHFPAIHPTINRLYLDNIRSSSALSDILFHFDDLDEAHITRCEIDDLNFLIPGHQLSLIEVDDILEPLPGWVGTILKIEQCPGFNDCFLEMMMDWDGEEFLYATNLTTLHICNCANFSAAGLIAFIDCRLGYEQHEDPEFQFQMVSLGGKLPHFSAEDILWLKENVTYFFYHPKTLQDDSSPSYLHVW
jgi:hypothetical protein